MSDVRCSCFSSGVSLGHLARFAKRVESSQLDRLGYPEWSQGCTCKSETIRKTLSELIHDGQQGVGVVQHGATREETHKSGSKDVGHVMAVANPLAPCNSRREGQAIRPAQHACSARQRYIAYFSVHSLDTLTASFSFSL